MNNFLFMLPYFLPTYVRLQMQIYWLYIKWNGEYPNILKVSIGTLVYSPNVIFQMVSPVKILINKLTTFKLTNLVGKNGYILIVSTKWMGRVLDTGWGLAITKTTIFVCIFFISHIISLVFFYNSFFHTT